MGATTVGESGVVLDIHGGGNHYALCFAMLRKLYCVISHLPITSYARRFPTIFIISYGIGRYLLQTFGRSTASAGDVRSKEVEGRCCDVDGRVI